MPPHSKLKAELYTVRSSSKKHGQLLVLEHYPELSSNLDTVLAWCRSNRRLIPEDMARTKINLVRLYRKAKVADLIGGENGERKAKFIYDLTRLVRCLFCTGSASLTFAAPTGWTLYSPMITDRLCHTVILSLRHLSLGLLSWAMESVGCMAWLRPAQGSLGMMNHLIPFGSHCSRLLQQL